MGEETSDSSKSMKDIGDKTKTTTGNFVKSIVQLGLMALGLGSVKSGSEDAEGGIGSLGKSIEGFVKKLADYAKTAKKEGKGIGENVPKGVDEGIKDNVGLVTNATEDMINDGIIEPSQKGLESHSPSKVAEKFGFYYDQGLANGIGNNSNLVTSSVTTMLSNVKRLFTNEYSTFNTLGSTLMSRLNSGMASMNSSISASVQSLISTINNKFDFGSTMYAKGKNIIQSFVNGMKSIRIPTPHITFTTSTSVSGGTATTKSSSSVSWYKKGGLFNGPSVIGVGEAGKEAVLPLESTSVMSALANSIVSSLSAKTLAKTPLMATGTVIPPKAIYETSVATNLQNTVADLKDAIGRMNMQSQQAGGQNNTYHFTGQINRRTLFEEFMEEAQLIRSQSGRNPFEMA